MANKKFVVKLSSEERAQLTGLISKGKTAARTALKARSLLKAVCGPSRRQGTCLLLEVLLKPESSPCLALLALGCAPR